jgi:hypothetical protein
MSGALTQRFLMQNWMQLQTEFAKLPDILGKRVNPEKRKKVTEKCHSWRITATVCPNQVCPGRQLNGFRCRIECRFRFSSKNWSDIPVKRKNRIKWPKSDKDVLLILNDCQRRRQQGMSGVSTKWFSMENQRLIQILHDWLPRYTLL